MSLPISFLDGYILNLNISDLTVICNINGLGLLVNISKRDIEIIAKNTDIKYKFHIKTYIQQEKTQLFGFLLEEDLITFEWLLQVKRFGSKSCMALLHEYTASQIYNYIAMKNINDIAKVKGLGKKTAEHVITALYPKVNILSKKYPNLFNNIIDDDFSELLKHPSIANIKNLLNELGYDIANINQSIDKNIKQFNNCTEPEFLKLLIADMV